MMTKNRFLILLIPILCLASALVSGQKTFQGSIVDAESGLPLAATVSLRNTHGDDLAPDGQTFYFVRSDGEQCTPEILSAPYVAGG